MTFFYIFTKIFRRERQQKILYSFLDRGFFAVRTGLEPVTPCVTGMYSNQLN